MVAILLLLLFFIGVCERFEVTHTCEKKKKKNNNNNNASRDILKGVTLFAQACLGAKEL
jgi:hypothetical protein